MNKSKKLYLTQQERANVLSRRNLVQQHKYYSTILEQDLDFYIRTVVFPRFKFSTDMPYSLNESGEFFEVEGASEQSKAEEAPQKEKEEHGQSDSK